MSFNDLNENYDFPYEINLLDEETTNKRMKDFLGGRTECIQVGPKKYTFSSNYEDGIKNIYNFQVRQDDVWIVTFPRSGTTMTQEMVWLLCNNCNFEKAIQIHLIERVPFLEQSLMFTDNIQSEIFEINKHDAKKLAFMKAATVPKWEILQNVQGPRFIKTHLPFSLLPPNLLTSGCKIIYVARNPQDVAVSYYHLNRMFKQQMFQNDFKSFWEYFSNNLLTYTPYWEHVKEGYTQKDNPNVLFMFYEEMNRNLAGSLHSLANFLDVSLTSANVKKFEDHLNIENFKQNKSVNTEMFQQLGFLHNGGKSFIRKGKVGNSKEYFDEELTKKYNDWVEYNKQHVINLEFPL